MEGIVLAARCAYKLDRPVRIMLLGDSITQGCCDGLHLGYRYFLWEELKRNGHGGHFEFIGTQLNLRNPRANDTVGADIKHLYPKYDEFIAEARMHEARSGAMIRDVWGPVEELLFKLRPDVVVMLLGINDLLRTKYDPRRIQRSQKDMSDFPDKMLKYSPHGTMIMCSLVPTRTPPPDFTKFNQMILSVTEKWGLPYVDLTMGYDPFKDNADEIHPDWSGERKIAERVYDAIIPLLPPPNTMDEIGDDEVEVGS